MEKSPTANGNGIHHKEMENGRKNRLRILGTAILERENEPNISASYNYTAACANEFFDEDIDRLQFFELNKIAMGLTIHKKELPNESLTNGHSENSVKKDSPSKTVLTRLKNNATYLTDVIWSRMDIQNPSANSNAYLIKQYYSNNHNGSMHQERQLLHSHGEKWNTFICGFISCLAMVLLIGCSLSYLPNKNLQT